MLNVEVIKTGVLSPRQFRLLLEQPKQEMHKVRMEFLLNTGMRYPEAEGFRFMRFDPKARKIHKPATGETRKQRERFVTITPRYTEKLLLVQKLLGLNQRNGLDFPPRNNFQKNLQYWLKRAGLMMPAPPAHRHGELLKTFRKARECWLILSGYDSALVALDQGHTSQTQLKHYLNNPFSDDDRAEMREYMKGWL